MVRLSFIVPCYKVENFVGQCLDSIIACGLSESEYEVLCINDGSPDNSSQILHRYASEHQCIRVVDLEQNIGLGGVRNLALKYTKGNYIWFVDSDDLIMSESVDKLIKCADSNKLDVLAFNFKDVDERARVIRDYKLFSDSGIMTGLRFMKDILGEHLYYNIGFVWRFIYKRAFLMENNLCFPEGVCWEDTRYVPESIFLSKRIMSTSEVGYLYRHRESSACNVFKKVYSGKLIFDFSICAGLDLIDFSRTISDNDLQREMFNFAIKRYIDYFPIFLGRTSKAERNNFIKQVRLHCTMVNEAKKYMSIFPKMIINKVLGKFVMNFFVLFYQITHKD